MGYLKQAKVEFPEAIFIDFEDFKLFLSQSQPFDFDIMLEIKDKEKSAIKAINFAIKDIRVKKFLKSLR